MNARVFIGTTLQAYNKSKVVELNWKIISRCISVLLTGPGNNIMQCADAEV
jgi:hypothetical protein